MNISQFKTIANTEFKKKFGNKYDSQKVRWELVEGFGYYAEFGVWEHDVKIDPNSYIGESWVTDVKSCWHIMYRKGKLTTYGSSFLPYSTWSDEDEY